MKAPTKAVLAATLLASLGCGTTDPIVCTEIFVYGIVLEVVDGTSMLPRAEGSTLTIRDGEYVESSTETFDGSTMVAAGERAGTYVVTVARNGYHTWSRTGVVVDADECHVIPVTLVAELEPIP